MIIISIYFNPIKNGKKISMIPFGPWIPYASAIFSYECKAITKHITQTPPNCTSTKNYKDTPQVAKGILLTWAHLCKFEKLFF